MKPLFISGLFLLTMCAVLSDGKPWSFFSSHKNEHIPKYHDDPHDDPYHHDGHDSHGHGHHESYGHKLKIHHDDYHHEPKKYEPVHHGGYSKSYFWKGEPHKYKVYHHEPPPKVIIKTKIVEKPVPVTVIKKVPVIQKVPVYIPVKEKVYVPVKEKKVIHIPKIPEIPHLDGHLPHGLGDLFKAGAAA